MKTAKEWFDWDFQGNASKAGRETGISRQTWQAWKKAGFPDPMPAPLARWIIIQSSANVPPPTPSERAEDSSPA